MLPERAMRRDPVRRLFDRRNRETDPMGAPDHLPLDQPGALEHPQVPRHRRQRDRMRRGQRSRRGVALRERGDERAARGIGQCEERGVEVRL